ncbi:sigma-54-dependent Fis family transcriptional regulator [Pseudonocardia sp. H11422]|uniref:sigma-54-dependent Fis family transcriptional regulator n=1 Tax=Pseudonocardia sp. H11422 TaxID=2835866 RepID=UPI001BDD71F6|nr:helix-turn-helix domain-containing protein [Pseudonocardia sp. H11422]
MTIGTAWEQFHAGEEPCDVRGEVLTSWRRSKFSGVDPEYVDVPYVDTDLDTHLTRVAVPIMTKMVELLVGDKSCLALSDARGSVVWRWVSEPMLRGTLDKLSVAQGFCFDEEFVGTNGLGTALETGSIAVVRGSEHFVHRFHDVTCVAAPVRHPITRRTVGAVNVTCRAEHTNPLLSVVVLKLVDEVQAALLHTASVRERRLLQAFLAAQRGTPGPVLTVGDDVIIANRAAADLGLDHREIWDEVRSLRDLADGTLVELPSNLSARLQLVRDGTTTTGAVLTVAGPVAEAAPRRRAVAPPDEPERWERLVADTRVLVAEGPVAVRGEAGTGKATLLATVLEGAVVIDAATCAVEGLEGWTSRFAAQLDRPDRPLVLQHAELLSTEAVRAAVALFAARAVHPPLGITITVSDARAADGPELILDQLGIGTVTLPPLRRRVDDIVGLAQRELHRYGERLTFALDAQTALRRYDWPGNVRELARVVRDAARQARGGVVGLSTLPAEVRAAAGRRVLTPLERAESSVIAAVLQECGGNKSAAAKELGISRTALYAKLRSYRL